MPRNGEGHVADNATETGHNLAHGAPESGKDAPVSSGVDRSHKAAAAPEHEDGEGIGATGQASIVTGSGKGPEKATVDEQAEKLSK
ncbi:hypothetical protein CLAFUW4_11325 [Fulvia fulva]|uniref:Uncharacterized protein n=1 Tax=Passalora fulva TaxID=5499 RepID=A0A9Q8PC22_PASFU|nr:uncharacterized protein CLAFUR5_10366 [Fulvia fulva]KAK4620215.1 hypothetical protein CLAFUR4_11331 [Fulvia fulva]KAK4620788.1 hypothetical protein CLAFUR0_11337 [Fulvia fulva]UJO19731.1 hypothetical protein CLAFUR5_10366 [Fulvia fulva]WPV17446.1 hypothetical protein CLAFUW4_11325 [Fulvia fulva]WPV32265.1 hypothetical protein CLAFUW7_11321 [Fulvia fulva]